MSHHESPTIAALATSPHPAGLAVVRMSGPKTAMALKSLFQSKLDPTLDPRRLTYGYLIDHKSKNVIDNCLAVYMPGPFSYTGEDVGEFQFHGSPLLVQKVLHSLYSFGLSPAEPGEFTKRAFLNGKIDLIQAEAIAELINASSEQALKIAGEHLKGRLSEVIDKVSEPLRDSLAEMEAYLDFPEEDISPESSEQLLSALTRCRASIKKLLETYAYGHVVRDGFRVLLCGQPNVGKSSLLNLLLGRERAIVTEISGTTRDILEENAILSGYKFVFCDSAGLVETNDKVEKIGIELAKERVGWADLVLFVVDGSNQNSNWQEVLEYLRGRAKKIWMITNKIDLNPAAIGTFFCDLNTCAQNFYLSAKTKSGLEELRGALVEEVAKSLPDSAHANNVVTSERQRLALERGLASLGEAITALGKKLPMEVVSAEIRVALSAMEEIVGKTFTEDILGRIFSKFCIGK